MSRNGNLDDLVSQWQRAREEGRELSAEELCALCPHLATELQRRIDVLARLEAWGRSPGSGPATRIDSDDSNPSTFPQPDQPLPPPPRGDGPPGYELLGVLGRGGMGVVYRARQIGLNRIVALKMILGGPHAGDEERLRFLAEAEALAGLRHPGIVQVHDFGTYDGIPYFALEFCPGGSLEERLKGKPIPPAAAAALILRLAEATHYAHQQGVIHRDLKPGNVLLRHRANSSADLDVQDTTAPDFWDFDPLITDFGLARRIEGQAGLTRPGAVMGTPSYMPPEQARGQEVGPAIDVYALGAIFYELLTGRPPFQGATPQETLVQVTALDPVPVCRLQPSVPADLETVCLKCLEKEPRKRYATAQDLADDLGRWQRGEPIHARPVGPIGRLWRWCLRNPTVASLVGAVIGLTVAALVVITLLWRQAALDRDHAREQEKLAQIDRDLANEARQRADEARKRADDERKRAEVFLYASQLSSALREIERARTPQAGRGRARLALALGHLDACRWDLRGWEHRLLYSMLWPRQSHLPGHSAAISALALSPDDRLIFTGSRDGTARLWAASGGEALRAFSCPAPVRSVALTSRHAAAGTVKGHLLIWDVVSGKSLASLRPIKDGILAGLAATPDGKWLVGAGSDQSLQVRELPTGRLAYQFEGLEDSLTCVAVSADGKLLAAGQEGGAVQVWELPTRKPLFSLAAGPGRVGQVAFSPDGRLIATAGFDRNVRVWNAATGAPARVLQGHTSSVSSVSFCPDGTHLLSASYDDTVRVWDVSTWQLAEELELVAGGVEAAAWGGRGRAVWCGGGDGGLRAVSMWGGGQRQFRFPFDVSALAWPPGGQLVSANWGGQVCLGRLALAGHKKEASSLAWSAGRLYSGGADGRIHEWDVAARKAVRALAPPAAGEPAGVTGLAPLPQGGLASCYADGTVCLWAPHGDGPPRCLVGADGELAAVACSPDGSLVAAAGSSGTIFLWGPGQGEPARLTGHTKAVSCLAFSPDGKSLASGGADHAVAIWDVSTGKGRPLEGHTMPVNCVTWCPGGSRLLSGGEDGHINVWEPVSGLRLLSLPAHGNSTVSCLAFRADGTLASGGYDRKVRVWEARLTLCRLRPQRYSAPLARVSVGPSGTVSGTCRKGNAVAWDGVTGQLLAAGALPTPSSRDLTATLAPSGEPVVIDRALARANRDEACGRLRCLCAPAPLWHLGRALTTGLRAQYDAAGFHLGQMLEGG